MTLMLTVPGKFSRASLSALIFLALSLLACTQQKGAPPKPVVPVTAATVEKKAVPYEIRAIGNIVEYASVNVRSQAGGYLSKIHFQKGQFVKKDAILFTIDPRSYKASLMQTEGALAKDQAQLDNARADEHRYAELVKKGYISKQQYEQSQAAANALEAVVKADQAAVEYAKVQLSFCYIHAPISGRLGDILLDEGNLVKAADDNKFLVTIRQMQPIYVSFSVPEKTLGEIKKYMASKQLSIDVYADKGDTKPEKGMLSFVDNTVDPTTGTIRLKGTLKNEADRLWPGQFVQVSLTLSNLVQATVVPSQAVQTGQDGEFVFVVRPDQTVTNVAVATGITFDGFTVITGGVQPGDVVVTDGQLRLVPGSRVQVKKSLSPDAPANAALKS